MADQMGRNKFQNLTDILLNLLKDAQNSFFENFM